MEAKKVSDGILRMAEIDKQMGRLHMNLMRLERERTKISKAMLDELYEEEHIL
ncbi:MAG TPA: hypothetical protein VI564_02290 [Candidatus Nanoarchaeia archaeon]|nr:hypothetical protein [Candidatus Nanoarchaeia archaeon]